MRSGKTLCLLTLALAAGAVLQATPAAAEPAELCWVNEEPCSEKNVKTFTSLYGWASPETPEATELSIYFPAYGISSVCEQGKAITSKGGGQVFKETILSFFTCSESCEISANNPIESSMEASGGGSGVVTLTKPRLTMACELWGGAKCTFGSTTMKLHVSGGESAMIGSLRGMELVEGSMLLCPAEATYWGVFEDINSPTYVTN